MTSKYKSALEQLIADQLDSVGGKYIYEGTQVPYLQMYKPDFDLGCGIFIECKGYHPGFKAALTKLLAVKRSNPKLDLRIVWGNSKMKITPTLTAEKWSDKHGFKWSHKHIPMAWLIEAGHGTKEYNSGK